MKNLFRILQNIFAPVRCVVCWLSWSYLCSQHEKYLLWYPTCCWYCTNPTTHTQNCNDHQSLNITWLSGMIVWFYYTNLVTYMIHKAKYWWSYHIFSYFAKKLSLLIQTHIHPLQKPIIITYIPMYHKKELYQRWYNQAQKLAEYLSIELQIPCMQLLKKTQSTVAQMKKNRKDRQKQTENLYEIIPTQTIPDNTIILVIDDVVTTWSTISTASQVLKSHFPHNIIRWVCIARNT